jgi:hypothetical protein
MTKSNNAAATSVQSVVLLPCPFCGDEAKLQKSLTLKWVKCRRGRCAAQGPCSESEYEAARRWNQREDRADAEMLRWLKSNTAIADFGFRDV